MNDLLHTLLGAALVYLGVLAGALSDRIRNGRQSIRRREQIEQSISQIANKRSQAKAIAIPQTSAHEAMASDVALALTTMGYTKPDALKAVNACAGSECATMETWTRAALRRCMRKEA